jgi:hypothetical protein
MKKFFLAAAVVALSTLAFAEAQKDPAVTAGKKAVAAPPAQAEKSVQLVFEDLMASIQDNDYQAFTMAVDDNMKAALSKEVFEKVVAQFAPRQKKGYTASYFGEVKKKGYRVFVWKLSFKDEGDDVLAELSMKDEKIGGFFLR